MIHGRLHRAVKPERMGLPYPNGARAEGRGWRMVPKPVKGEAPRPSPIGGLLAVESNPDLGKFFRRYRTGKLQYSHRRWQ